METETKGTETTMPQEIWTNGMAFLEQGINFFIAPFLFWPGRKRRIDVFFKSRRFMSALIDPDDDPVERCSALCSECLFELKQDVFAIDSPESHDQHEDVPFKSTVINMKHLVYCSESCSPFFADLQVGLVLRGTAIDSTVLGGPAYASQMLSRGDIIVKVDDQPATDQNVSLLLVGNDKPGSKVTLSVEKNADKVG